MLTQLPTLSTENWETDTTRIIDKRLAEYMIFYKLDSDYAQPGVMSIENDISLHKTDSSETIERIRSSIIFLLKDYVNNLVVTVDMKERLQENIIDVTIKISGIGADGYKVDAAKIYNLVNSKVVSLNNL